ncbi:uncharacterized protein PFL1_01373 [Pseudozyma flocculosa PF-1]|uniref:Probable mfs-multidrug-resistance transporter n=1 Tax=Pseudozyma flocculosa TaxID=84751 RepID=A0A5C3EZ59_9BASI|nr:uncharacterized protein PFL1_01373 [Pseudozyma flocculosa PF-1]EPQ31185.1 hypothetical protein PFL1_01373 [Pseudozyma flocculosa PF-1]SPO36321.1 probable mfs-multidrug-resistance transporter [Pseudozyma flocculosa]
MSAATQHAHDDAEPSAGIGQRALHELVKLLVGHTPKGGHNTHLRRDDDDNEKQRTQDQHRPRAQRTELDEEIEENRKRTARFGGDDPLDPEEERRYVEERMARHHGQRPLSTHSQPQSGSSSGQSTVVGNVDEDDAGRKQKDEGHQPQPRRSGSHSSAGDHGGDGDNDDSEKTTPDPNEVGWNGPDDPENPQNWSQKLKWTYTVLGAILTINVTFASSAPSSTSQQLAQEFQIGTVTATLITSLFLAGYVLGPILWSTTSELFGRKLIFSFSMLVYTLFILGQSLAKNPETLFITRFLSGVFASAPLTNAGGLIADLWDPVGRGFAMSVFSASVFIGPVLGPIVGGFVTQSYLQWRWVFHLMMIFAAAVWIMTVLFLPETFAPVLLVRKAKRLRRLDPVKNKDLYAPHERTDWSVKGVLHRTLYRPFEILALEPMLVAVTIYLSVIYGLLYALFEAVPVIFADLRGFNLGESGLIFIAVGAGTTIGAVINVLLQLKYIPLVPFWKGSPPPEERLIGSMVAGPILVVGCFWLGWTGNYPAVPWYVPALSLVFIGMSFTLVFISLLSFIVDCYLMYAASALAANTIVRSAVGAGMPLVTRQFFTNVGVGWASSIVGFVGVALTPVPFIFYFYGSRIRGWSRFAPALDLKVRKQLEKEGKLPKDSLRSWKKEALSGLPQAKEELKRSREERESGGQAA